VRWCQSPTNAALLGGRWWQAGVLVPLTSCVVLAAAVTNAALLGGPILRRDTNGYSLFYNVMMEC